ncbi:unnamed protein product [Camellia sinensis]
MPKAPSTASNQPHTFVVVTLDPPIRKGQTLYPHIVLQFETDYVVECTLSINEDLLNSKYKDKLEPSYKVTRPGKFRSCQDGYAVKSSLKAEDGIDYVESLSFNRFSGPIPPSMGNLFNLYWLDLTGNNLSGTIPVSNGSTPGKWR